MVSIRLAWLALDDSNVGCADEVVSPRFYTWMTLEGNFPIYTNSHSVVPLCSV